MITIFNRKELCITYDMSGQAMIRNLLSDHNVDFMYEYAIYVYKSDYVKAAGLIGKF